MRKGVEAKLDGETLVVRIPMRFQRRGGRKRLIAPDGSVVAPNAKPAPDGTLLKALARAWRWQRMLDEGVYASVSDIGDAENISKSYVSRILRLALLAPEIVEAILAGRTDQGIMLEQLKRPLPASWKEQLPFLACRAGSGTCADASASSSTVATVTAQSGLSARVLATAPTQRLQGLLRSRDCA